jgi:hypothetical protein
MGQAWRASEHEEDKPVPPERKSASPLEVLRSEFTKIKQITARAAGPPVLQIVILSMVAIIWTSKINNQFTTTPGIIFIVVLPYAIIAALIAIARLQSKFLQSYRKALPEQIRKVGLVERLALGSDALPDIFGFTPFPWQFFLGQRPKTFKLLARLLAENLDWYLLPEPRMLLRISWPALLISVAIVVWWVGTAFLGPFHLPSSQPSSGVPVSYVDDASEGLQLIALYVLMWIVNHQRAKQHHCSSALLDELDRRLAEENS